MATKKRIVKLEPENLKVETNLRVISGFGPGLEVHVYGIGLPKVDREPVHLQGWILGPNQVKLAKRLESAIMAGKLLKPEVELLVDVNGKTYYSSDLVVYTHRRMNAALKSIGF